MTSLNGALSAGITAGASFGGHKVITTGFPYKKLGVKVELLLNTTWTDITSFVLVRDNITISPFGRTDEASSMQAGQVTLTLKNADGRFTPNNASGAYYPYIQLNGQLRISVNDTSSNGTVYAGYRFWGEVSEWPPQWDPSGRSVYVTITASGIWRRLSQATTTLGSPFTRWNTQLANSYTLAGYWPMEDSATSGSFAAVAGSAAAMTIIPTNGTPSLASCTAFPGSDALPQLNGAEFSGLISTSSSPTQIMFRFCLFVQAGGDTGAGISTIARLHLGTNTSLNYVDVGFGSGAAGGPFTITGYNSGNSVVFSSTLTDQIWGKPIMLQVGLVKSGSNVNWSLNTILPSTTTWYGTTTGTATGVSIADVSSVIFSPGAAFKGVSVGQAAVYYANPSITTDASALGGWSGENALTRFGRICTEQGIAYESIGTTSTPMGPQIDDTLVNVLQSIEDTDGGLIYEARDKLGLGYRTMSSLQNQSAVLTLDYSAAQVGQSLAPVNDDALIRNDVNLANFDGYSVRTYLASGARSLQSPPNGVGSGYAYARNVNSTSHTQINALGSQILNCGTTFQNRYPTMSVNLARVTTASLFGTAPSMRIGDFLQVNNMPSFMGGGSEKQLAWGWTETINYNVWTITYNTIPEAPWESSFNPGTSSTAQIPGSPVTSAQAGSISGAQIAEGAVIGANIASGTVSGTNIALGTITATNIATATITGSNIANATITGTQIATGTISGSNIVNASITGTQIATGTITATNIANATITSAQISTSANISGSQIGTGTITAGNITNATITNAQIAGGTITGSNIGSSTITGANLANATITSVQISNGTITTTQISNSANITGTQIASGTIVTGNIAANTITAGNIAAGTITTTQIAANTIVAGNIASGTITAAQIAAATITGTQIAASVSLTSPVITGGTITGGQLIAYGSTGELLVYSGTPATGNMVMSASAVSGTDSHSNSYPAGIGLFNSSTAYTTLAASTAGNLSLGTGSGGGGGLEMVTQSSTPFSQNSIFYADSNGTAAFRNGSAGFNGQLVNSIGAVPSVRTANSGTATAVTPLFTVPAGDATAGTTYRIKATGVGTYSSGNNTWWEIQAFGGNQAQAGYASLPGSFMWETEAVVSVVTAGATGTAYMCVRVCLSASGVGASPGLILGYTGGTGGTTVSIDTTSSTTIGLICAGNGTFSIKGITASLERIGP